MKSSPIVVLSSLAVLMLASLAAAQAPCGSGGGQIGPCPGLIDSNRNGLPDPGVDQEINFMLADNMLTIQSPWSGGPCGNNEVELYGASGPYTSARRLRPTEDIQEMTIAGFDNNGDPTIFGFYDSMNGTTGRGVLQDANGDFRYESMRLEGGAITLTLSFVGADLDGDSQADYVSVPWSHASMFGMNGSCGMPGGDPQIWLPMDGDRIVPGYPGFYPSPRLLAVAAPLQGPNVPALAGWGLPVMVAILAAIGWWFARNQRLLG